MDTAVAVELGELVLVGVAASGGVHTLLPGGEMQISSATDRFKLRQLPPKIGFPVSRL